MFIKLYTLLCYICVNINFSELDTCVYAYLSHGYYFAWKHTTNIMNMAIM